MKNIRVYIILTLLLLLSFQIYGQAVLWHTPVEPSKQKIYTDSRQFMLKFSPGGMQLGYRLGKLPNFYTDKYYQFEIGQIRQAKELNSGLQSLKSSISRGFFKNYIYGKQNSLYTLYTGNKIRYTLCGPVRARPSSSAIKSPIKIYW